MDRKFADEVMDATAEKLAYLHERWRDEEGYEEFSSYSAVIEKLLAAIEGVTFIAMQKRPWGFKWRAIDGFERLTRLSRNHVETIRIGLAAGEAAQR